MKNLKNILMLFLFLWICPYYTYGRISQENMKEVKGVVLDEYDEPIPGATIILQKSTRGCITDIDGKFTINVSLGDVLLVSFLGYQTFELKITANNTYSIRLIPQIDELEEVTVVAFAKQKKESVISSVTTVKPSELRAPTSNLTTAMAGRMSGVIAYQSSGEPGNDNANFFIRGVTTFGYKKDPLILIDNVELTSDDLARLSVDDIASFSIMKDATATALYGARGANGVILVTTKEGKEGKAKVSFRIENSISTPTKMIQLADPITYMYLENEAVRTRNPLGVIPHSDYKIKNTIEGTNPYLYPAIDWYDELFSKTAINQRANLSVSGGGNVARYYIAASYNKDNGVMKVDKRNNFNNNIDLQKFSVRSNININLTKTTEAIIRFQGNFDDYTGPLDGGNELYTKVMRTSPVMFPKYYPAPENSSSHIRFGNYTGGRYINPYADMVKGYKTYNRTLVLAQGELKQKLDFITPGLNARGLISTTRYVYSDAHRNYNPFYYMATGYDKDTDSYTLWPLNEGEGTEYLNYRTEAKDVITTNYIELAVSYNREFDVHGISGMLVYTLRNENRLTSREDDLQKTLPYRNQGLSGRFTYSYANKYFAEFNFGYNGSERFSKNERYGFFPSIGLGYIISNEDFWSPLQDKISKLKFKATYGLVGNDAIGDENDRFFYMSNVNMNASGNRSSSFGKDFGQNYNGITMSRYANPFITWEKSQKMNLGVELNLFNSVEIQADYFYEKRTDILMERSYIPATMGLQAKVAANLGEASGQGVDFSIDYTHSFNKDMWMQGRVNYTYAVSKYLKVEESDYAAQGTPWRSLKGLSLAQQRGYIAERLFIDEADVANSAVQNFGGGQVMAGDIKYKDIDGDGVITEADMVPIGYPRNTPEISYGFGLSAGYKNFDLSLFFQGNARSSFWLNPDHITPFVDTDGNGSFDSSNALLQRIADSHWSEANRDIYAFWPRLANYKSANNSQLSTWWMQNGGFLRLKSAEMGYSLPRKIARKCHVDMIRLYVNGTNLLTFSKFKLWDPEMGENGLRYPIQRVYNIGLNVNF